MARDRDKWKKHPTPPSTAERAVTEAFEDAGAEVDPAAETEEIERALEPVPPAVLVATAVHELAYLLRVQVDAGNHAAARITLQRLVSMLIKLGGHLK